MLVSVIIPCYNEEQTIKQVVKAALEQDYKPKEVIVVNDASSDKSGVILDSLEKQGAQIITNKHNRGLAGSLNKGIRNSKGGIIVTLLGDCIPASKKWLSELVIYLKDPAVVAVASRVNNPKRIWNKFDPLIKDLLSEEVGMYSPALDEKGCAYRRTALNKAGLFDEKRFRTAGEDFDMLIRIRKEGKVLSGIKPYVMHTHLFTLRSVYVRWASYARGFGVLYRMYRKELPLSVLMRAAFPFWAIGKTIKIKARYSSRLQIFLALLKMNLRYLYNFVKGYILMRQ